MAVITIALEQSPIQILAGIPKYVILETNIPSTIFYTLDGSIPDINSNIYIDSLELPTNNGTLILKILATNGVDSSGVISYTFGNYKKTRDAHDKVINIIPKPLPGPDLFPFGNNHNSPPYGKYNNIAEDPVNSILETQIPDGYDGNHNISNYTNENIEDYDIVYSDQVPNSNKNTTGNFIGTLPNTLKIYVPDSTKISPNANNYMFNPRALVIYQDGRFEQKDPDMPLINRESFSLRESYSRDGFDFRNSGFDGSGPTGFLVRTAYNAAEQTITFYYRDTETNRWIISKEPITKNPPSPELNQTFTSSKISQKVFKWIPFKRQHLR
jgi:hypothetical protein